MISSLGCKPVSKLSLYPPVLRTAEHLVSPKWYLSFFLSLNSCLCYCYCYYLSYLPLQLWDTAGFLGGGDVTATRSCSRSLWGNDPVMWALGDCHVLSTGGTSPFLTLSLCTYQCTGPEWESHTQRHVAVQAWGCASNQQRLPSLWSSCEP